MNVTPLPATTSDEPNLSANRPVSVLGPQLQLSSGDNSEGAGFDQTRPRFSGDGENCSSSVEESFPASETQHQERNPDVSKSRMVAGPLLIGLPKPHRPPDSIWKINHDVSAGYSKLMDMFSQLMVDIYENLIHNSASVEKFTLYLMGIKCNMKFGVSSPEGVALKDIRDWTEMFDKLSDVKAWDCLNYELLRTLVDKYFQDNRALIHKLNEYDAEVQRFIDATTLLDFLDVYKELFPDDSNLYKGCKMLMAKLELNLSKMTLADYYSTRAYLTSQFRLQHYLFRLAVANEGCVILYWYVPDCCVSQIEKTCKELQPDFGQAGIIELCLDDLVLYQALNIKSIQEKNEIYPVSDVMSNYDNLLAESINNPKEFWSKMAAKTLVWEEPFTKEKILDQCNMANGDIHWFDGKLNASVNCLDRHAKLSPHKTAIIWAKNDGSSEKISYQKLLEMTCQIAHVLKGKGVVKNYVVLIYMPSSPKAVAAMLACTRIGAVHSVAYAVLKNNELKARINDANAKCVITSDVAIIGDKKYFLKKNVDKAWNSISLQLKPCQSRFGSTRSLNQFPQQKKLNKPPLLLQRSLSSGATSLDEEELNVEKKSTPQFVVLVSKSSNEIDEDWDVEKDFILEEEMANYPTTFEPEYVEAEHTMFIMYTSGTTAATTPTGIKHCTAGYLLYVALTHQYVFDYKLGDVFGCMADLGWITGHSYVVYGPLCNGATTVLFEGTATYPNNDRYWKAISDHKINQFYVTPYVISQLMKLPNVSDYREQYDLSSLKTIATVGEPLSNHVLHWLIKYIGHDRCRFVDTWWQTEMGGIALVIDHEQKSLPDGTFPAKPFFGVDPVIIDPKFKSEICGNMVEPGYLCLRKPLPGMGRGVTSICRKSFKEMYFEYTGFGFFTHDLALRLKSGGYRVTGRLNSAIRIQGSWLDVASIEDQMNKSDDRIVKTALVGIPDKHFSTDKYDYEGACVLLECSSDDAKVREEVHTNVMNTIRKDNLLPEETVNGIIPGAIVLFVSKWILTPSGKTIVSLYQDYMNVVTNLWLHTSPENMSFISFCSKQMNCYIYS